jgi:uncharacterized protein (DUF885 family)
MKFFVLFLVLLACSHKNPKGKNIDQVFSNYWEERSKLFPLEATQQGDNRYNDILPNDQTAQFRQGLDDFYTRYLHEVESFDRSKLSDSQKTSYDLFVYEMKMNLEGSKLPLWAMPFQQFWGLPLTMGQLGSGESYQPFKTLQDYQNWMYRMEAFGQWMDSAIQNFRDGIKMGVVLPKTLVKKTIPQMEDLARNDPKKNIFFAPLNKIPASISEADKAILVKRYKEIVTMVVLPTYKRMATFLKKEYLPKARNTHGIDGVKGGKEIYSYLVRYWTTTNKTPDEIHAIGLGEVARIKSEMEAIKNQTGYKGNLKSFFNYLKTDKKFYPFKTDEEVLNFFRSLHKKIKPKLPTMFSRFPKTPFEIRQTEKFREASASAEYNPGSPDGTRPGIFYMPIIDAKKYNLTSGMESVFLHEAIPGHHFQISLQQENTSLPNFRRFNWYGAYGEGWALYTESLGRELGLYTDPYQYMGALGDEMHRAVRLVVDVAIHTKGMTRDQAIKYMMEQEPISKDGAVAEIERYMAIPGQALSYKVGALKIRELRNQYAQNLGDKFQLTKFHDEVLAEGCLPLSVLESHMNEVMK